MKSETMKGEQLWHYRILLLGQRAAQLLLAVPPTRHLPAALPIKRLLVAHRIRCLPAVQLAAPATSDLVRNAL